jgi:hypothetical protein
MKKDDERILWFSKIEHGAQSRRKIIIFDDGSACVDDGDTIEICFEGDSDAWRDAIQYLTNQGYAECPPEVDP